MELPEFRVTLTRVKPGESAYPRGPGLNDKWLGQRSKFGGRPDLIHDDRPLPKCSECDANMIFVAQIDSIEHDSPSNPHAVPFREQKWMFGDVGMIYVFLCSECGEPQAFLDFY